MDATIAQSDGGTSNQQAAAKPPLAISLRTERSGEKGRTQMCGIAGSLSVKEVSADRELLGQMIATIRYRGPDDIGIYSNGPIGLAHARLSIIDIAGGH